MGLWRACLIVAIMCGAQGASALDYLGSARLFTDDFLGDRHDRWRSFSYQSGFLFAPPVSGLTLDMIELRFGAEAISPWSLKNPDPDDRPFAGVLRAEMHGYFDFSGYEMAAGLGISSVGSQTGIDDLMRNLHNGPSDQSSPVWRDQIGNRTYPELSLELAHPVLTGPGLVARPYLQMRSGIEDLITFGADIIVGDAGVRSMRVRDQVTGHLLPRSRLDGTGGALALGLDFTYVAETDLLPQSRTDANSTRWRARSGLLWRAEKFQVFYGATWLSQEFAAQPESQVVGSLQLNFEF